MRKYTWIIFFLKDIAKKICLIRRHEIEILRESINLVQSSHLKKFM